MKAIRKDFYREIRHSRSRFLSIMVLSALAVAFLSGLRSTAPDMKRTGDAYLDEYALQDIQVMSTLGITEADVRTLAAAEGVSLACGGYQIDALANTMVIKVNSITEGVNELCLMEGRMPQSAGECLVDAELSAAEGFAVGDSITVEPGGSYEGSLKSTSSTIVGAVRSPYYISPERGSASIGSGSVDGYIYLLPEAFSMDCYTVCYLRLAGAEELIAFEEEYNDFVDAAIERLEPLGEQRAAIRYREIVDDAEAELAEAEQELADARAEVTKELTDAERELADARRELDEGQQSYEDGKAELADAALSLAEAEEELTDAYRQLQDGERDYRDGLAEWEEGKEAYDDGRSEYTESAEKLSEALEELTANETKLSESTAALGLGSSFTAAEAQAAIDGACAQLTAGIAQCDAGLAALADNMTSLGQAMALTGDPTGEYAAALAAMQAQQAELQTQKSSLVQQHTALAALDGAALADARRSLDSGWDEYESGKSALDAAKKELRAAKKELDEGEEELKNARDTLDTSWEEYNDGVRQLADGREDYARGLQELSDAEEELRDGEREYKRGYREYSEGKQTAEEELSDAEKELSDARRKVADIESGSWYILSRAADPGYTAFGEDADRIANLARVFPLIFFLVAALVCLTTMTRMVEEERTQIGLMKAMGYRRFSISRKYLSYGLLPSLVGSLLGLAVGYTLFPTMIYSAWQIMYETPDIILCQYTDISLFSTAAAVGCTAAATLSACLSTLRDVPANLMRPRAPKAGKRVLLERIGGIWRHLNFHQKVTVRNLFRYQKRFWMTVLGIGGCTALIMAGFGIRFSILSMMGKQYDGLSHYDTQLVLSTGILPEERQEIDDYLQSQALVSSYTDIFVNSVTTENGSHSQSAYVEVISPEEVGTYMELRNFKTQEPLTLGDDGVLIDQKLSELLELEVGDSFTISSDGRYTATVAGIYEHYLGHFVYMSPAAYRHIFSEDVTENAMLLCFADSDKSEQELAAQELLSLSGVSSVSHTDDVRSVYQDRMERIDFVVVIVILCAAALAIVVLYNLSCINITERQREMATLKVLGFHDLEVTAYIVRENVILTLFGVALGCLMGKFLHRWLILTVEIDLVMFGRTLDGWCYVWSSLLTLVFSGLVNLMAHRRMKGIDMVESLKSAE